MSIDVRNVSKFYGVQKALDQVSFQVNPGEIVGFLGPNGAGKSTMMKIISGYLPQNEGEVFVCGKDVRTEEMEIKKVIGYLPENNPLYTEMYVREYLEFSAGLFRMKNVSKRVDEVIEQVGLSKEKNKKIGALSKGYRQRVGLGQAFLHNPSVLILDEPTTGLDPNQIQEIRQLIQTIGKNKTVMLSTHIMQEVEAICSRAIIISDGKIVADKPIGELKKSSSSTTSLQVTLKTEDGFQKLKHAFKNKGLSLAAHLNIVIDTIDLSSSMKEVMQFAVENNIEIVKISEVSKGLEDVFRDLTNSDKSN